MKASIVGVVMMLAAGMMMSTSVEAGGWKRGHGHDGRHHRHHPRHYDAPRHAGIYEHHYYRAPSVVRRDFHRDRSYHHYDEPRYYYYPRHSSHNALPIVVGGALGGFLGHELSYGDSFGTGLGAVAGAVLGHEIAD